MVGYLRALATDYDGTLSHNGQRPDEAVLDAVGQLRRGGCRVLLVTGRILSELREVFPDVDGHFDAIVAENGCVLSTYGRQRLLAAPVDPRLADDLGSRGLHVRSGEVILAGSAADRSAVLEEVHRLELDCQLVFNRTELMILPSGLNKGTGLFDALGDLGISRHSTVGVGDAENDRGLLDVCEVGVAVSDSVESLKEFADVILADPDGAGVVDLIADLVDDDAPTIHSQRWQLRLGTTPEGSVASVPSSQMSILICGAPGAGKSHLAGLFAERLIAQGYCVLVVDPEGDHQGLGRLRGVVVVDGQGGLPSPERVTAIFSQRYSSVVLDLSQVPEAQRQPYLVRLAEAVTRSRETWGLPHWIIDDEAHSGTTQMGGDSTLGGGAPNSGRWGACMATFRPDLIDPAVLASVDCVVAMRVEGEQRDDLLDLLVRTSGEPPAVILAEMEGLDDGTALLAPRPEIGPTTPFRVASRVTEHQRHRHKYAEALLPGDRCFYFRDGSDSLVHVAHNLREFRDVVSDCSSDVIEHHVGGHDFSRWLDRVFSDGFLASQMATIEGRVEGADLTVDDARGLLIDCVQRGYGV